MLFTRNAHYHLLTVILLLLTSSMTSSSEVLEYCNEEIFAASCQPNQAVVMDTARYGRMRLGKCVKRNLGYLGCAVDALRFFDSRCSGQTSCELSLMDTTLREMRPCPKDVTWHLEASYSCVDVMSGTTNDCNAHHHVTASDQSGYLSSSMASRTGIGSSTCPWRIQVQTGQRINITLLNFVSMSALQPPSPPEGGIQSSGKSELCYDVATIRDGPAKRSVAACSGEQRQRSVYQSSGSAIEVEFAVRNPSSQTPPSSVQFLIQYHAVGCPNMASVPGTTVSRDGETTTLRCNLTGETWYLTCSQLKWVGSIGNCSVHSTHTWNSDELFGQSGSFPLGILIVVAVGVALGVFLGGTMLLLASLFMKRRQRQRLSRQELSGVSDDLKDCDQGDYTMDRAKHYIVPDYMHHVKDGAVPGATECGFEPDYGSEPTMRDRLHQQHHEQLLQQQQRSLQNVHIPPPHPNNPRILYHVYESPQLT